MTVTIAGTALPLRPPRIGRRHTVLAAALAAVLLGATWVAHRGPAAAPSTPPGSQPVVFISGRDDHGLLRDHYVPLYATPDGKQAVGQAHDATLARILERRGQWLHVRTVDVRPVEGWLDDFYLRDRALRTDGGGQVTLAGAEVREGRVWAAVRPLVDPRATPVWLPLDQLKEVGARDP